MKTFIIIIIFLFIGLFDESSVAYKIEYHADKLVATPIKEISNKLKVQLHILQKNVRKYDSVLKVRSTKNIVMVVPDTLVVHKK